MAETQLRLRDAYVELDMQVFCQTIGRVDHTCFSANNDEYMTLFHLNHSNSHAFFVVESFKISHRKWFSNIWPGQPMQGPNKKKPPLRSLKHAK